MSVSQDTSATAADPGCGDKRRLRKTKTPGVFKRVDGAGQTIGYVCVFRSAGRQRKRHARTYDEAKRIKRESETDRDRGELQERTTIGFLRYVDEWVERYRGQGRRGFRESTREEYRRLIRAYAHRHFPRKLKLADVSTYALARFMDWIADEEEQGKRLSDRTIANAVIPLRAALATAKREGLIRHNPAQGLAMPHREQLPDEEVKVFSRDQLAAASGDGPRPPRDCSSSSWPPPACESARRSPSSTCTSNSTRASPRSASVAPSSATGSCRPRANTAAARSAYRRRLRRSCAPTWPPSPIKTRPPSPSPAKQAARSTPATSAAASSSRSQRRSTPPGPASTRSATPLPRSTSAKAPTSSN